MAALCLPQPQGFLDMDGIIGAVTSSHFVSAGREKKKKCTRSRFSFQNDYCEGTRLPYFGTTSHLLGGLNEVEVGHKRKCMCVCV